MMEVMRLDETEDFFPEIVPLVDIVLLVLIFFLVTASYVTTPQQLDVTVPKTEIIDGPAAATARLVLTETGRVRFQGEWFEMTELPAVLENFRRRVEQPLLLITADASSKHGQLIELITAARRAGIEEYGFEVILQREGDDG